MEEQKERLDEKFQDKTKVGEGHEGGANTTSDPIEPPPPPGQTPGPPADPPPGSGEGS